MSDHETTKKEPKVAEKRPALYLAEYETPNDVAKAAWDKKQPAEWVFTGVWRRRDKTYMDIVPPWLGMAMVFKLPIAKDPSAII